MEITVRAAHRINHINVKLLNLIENYFHRIFMMAYKNGLENWPEKTANAENEAEENAWILNGCIGSFLLNIIVFMRASERVCLQSMLATIIVRNFLLITISLSITFQMISSNTRTQDIQEIFHNFLLSFNTSLGEL